MLAVCVLASWMGEAWWRMVDKVRIDSDQQRVEALRSYSILDTGEEPLFDAITAIVADLLDVPISLVTLIDEKRQWLKSHHGLEVQETPRHVAFCNYAIEGEGAFIVSDASKDERFSNNPLVVGEPKIRFYAGVPLITPDGYGLGTLCAVDRMPRQLSPMQIRVLEEFAALVARSLETHRRLSTLANMQRQFGQEQERKELLAAMVVHDLRSPLSVIAMAASLGSRMTEDPAMSETLSDVLSAAGHMELLLGDVLDICLAEGGMLIPRLATTDLVALVRQQIREQRRAAKSAGLTITMTENTQRLSMQVDPMLLRRIVTNLLDNAIKFSPRLSTIVVDVSLLESHVEISISDQATLIPTNDTESIFLAHRTGVHGKTGYGLGLAFCRLACEVHGGSIHVEECSKSHGNRFVVKLPFARL